MKLLNISHATPQRETHNSQFEVLWWAFFFIFRPTALLNLAFFCDYLLAFLFVFPTILSSRISSDCMNNCFGNDLKFLYSTYHSKARYPTNSPNRLAYGADKLYASFKAFSETIHGLRFKYLGMASFI